MTARTTGSVAGSLEAEAEVGEQSHGGSSASEAGRTSTVLGGQPTVRALFKQAVFDEPPWPQLVASLLLAALVPVGLAAPTLALAAAVGLVLVGLAGWETSAGEVITGATAPRR